MKTGTSLYRDPENGKIAGVCAGIAEYFNLETWLVRILTVTAFFLMAGPFVIVTYIAAWFILDKKPANASDAFSEDGQSSATSTSRWGESNWYSRSTGKGNKNQERKIEVKKRVWQAGEPPREAFFDIQERFRVAELKLRKLEGYVTSKEYQINREISRL
jgi:phage shock protein C